MSKPTHFLCHAVTQNLSGTQIELKPAADGVALTSGLRLSMTPADAALFGDIGEVKAGQKFTLTITPVSE